QPVVWQGVTYEPWPIKASGFDKTGQGTLPRPKIQVSNFAGTVSAEVQANDDLVGCRIIRKMTLARFLDAVNFKDGNPTADPNQHFPDEMWFIEQKTLETHQVVEFELSSVFDLMGVQLPYRQIIKNTCPWKYRGPECGYTGPYFDKNNQQTSMSGADYCTKRYDACNARRNYFADGVIHFGGFIGATRYG
ncbi:phage minor tail protein L, partial [Escherichia coli]|nr:phage minor tail protein L [Escherichia coli]